MTQMSDRRERLAWGRRSRGEVIAERYRLDGIVGAGGMGTVFRGYHLALHTPVAIKLLRGSLSDRELFSQRFRREARVAARLRHPNAVQIHDFGTHDDQAYIIMELVDGEPLSKVVRERRAELTVDRCVRIGRVLADVLGAAHAMSIIHRDLKPDNIIIDLQGDDREWVTVIDFGLAFVNEDRDPETGTQAEIFAKEHDDEDDEDDEGDEAGVKTLFEIGRLTQVGRTAGTPRYVSPEQARGAALTGAADIYSLGCVLYELLAARPPFVGRTAPDIVNQHLFVAPRPPSRSTPGIPAWLDALIMEMLDKRPHARPSAQDIGAVLDEHLKGGPQPGGRGSFRVAERSERIFKAPELSDLHSVNDLMGTQEHLVTVVGRAVDDALTIAMRINGLAPEPPSDHCDDAVAPDAAAALLRGADDDVVRRLAARGVAVVCEEDPRDFVRLTRLLRAGAAEVVPLDSPPAEVARVLARAIDTARRRRERT